MRFSKKNKIILLFLLVAINITIRYPNIPHAAGADTFLVYGMANSISSEGYAKWVIHPASFFGQYPLSYPSALPFSLSGISQIFGFDVEHAILFFDMILAIFGLFAAYLMAKAMVDDDFFAFIVAFTFSLSPAFINFTYWGASSRNMFIAILPISIYFLFKIKKMLDLKLFIWIIFFVLLVAVHKMFLFLPIIVFIYLFSLLMFKINTHIEKRSVSNSHIHFFYISLIILALFFIIQFTEFSPVGSGKTYNYQTGRFFSGTDTFTIILNMFTDYIGNSGILILIGWIGLYKMMIRQNKNFYDVFVVILLMVFSSILLFGMYVSLFMLPIFSILIGISLIEIYKIFSNRQKIFCGFLTICLIISIGFSIFMLKTSEGTYLSEKEFNTGNFIKYNTNSAFIANVGVLAGRISAVSLKKSLPPGGNTGDLGNPFLLINDIADKNDLKVYRLPISAFSPNSDSIYVSENIPGAKNDWAKIMLYRYDDNTVKKILTKYELEYSVEEDSMAGKFFYWSIRNSDFLSSLHKEKNKIYTNSGQTIWKIY